MQYHSRSRGQLLGVIALTMLFLGGAVASIWLTLRDSHQRQLLGAIRTHPQRLDFSGRVDWQMRIRGRMVALTLDIQHWHPDRTRLDLVELDHPWFKGRAKDNPLVQRWLSRLERYLKPTGRRIRANRTRNIAR